jgi:predicted dehydrogenase
MRDDITRRNFIQKSSLALAGTGAILSRGAASASERVRLGVIGTANRGGQLIDALKPHADAEIVAFCDVHGVALERWKESFGSAAFYGDYREMLDRDDIDAVVIATPDHWHALQTIQACDAGKDVYVEKPLSLKVVEGRRMVEAARRNNRVVQTGLHRRSSTLFRELAEQIQGGLIGKVTSAYCFRISNMAPTGIGRSQPATPPEDLDWDFWIGPQKMRPYQDNIAPYKFRWWKDYSSQLGNWGVHYFDLIRWIIGETSPVSVVALGGRYAVDDDRTIPDTMQAVFELPSGCLLTFSHYEASNNFPLARPGEIEIRGTLGTLYASEKGYEIVPERGGQFMDRKPRMEPLQKKSEDGDLTVAHMRNFLDCIKTRNRPHCDVEDGHLSTTFAHLANISLDTRLRLDWDAAAEHITNNEQANQLLQYEYRPPWTLA